MSGTVSESLLLNAANWEYYQSLAQVPNGLTPLFNSNSIDPSGSSAGWQNDGMNAQVFQITGTSQLIVAFEGTNTDPSGSAYTAAFAKGSLALDDAIASSGLPGHSIDTVAGLQDATAFMSYVKAYAGANGLVVAAVTGHSLGAGIASYVSYRDGYDGTGFAPPGLGFPSPTVAGGGTFTNVVDYGDAIGNYANNPPNPEGPLPALAKVSHYGTTTYIGDAATRSVPQSIAPVIAATVSQAELSTGSASAYAISAGDTIGEGAKIFLGTGFLYHPINNYAAELGITLTNRTPADATGTSQLGSLAGGGTGVFPGIPVPNTATIPDSAADIATMSALLNLEAAKPGSPIVVASIYDGTEPAKTEHGFLPAFTTDPDTDAPYLNIAVLDPNLTQTTGSGTSTLTTSLDPSGSYAAP
ncbi:MAG: hypothetical protein INR65_18115, partial [Gluconacetobacter diazotrophicus]|nr:hypothetical protein [Gluconacetobacter diazotrophicus]